LYLLGEGIGQTRDSYPSQSPEFSSFPNGNKVFMRPLSQMFGRSRYQAVTATAKRALKHERDTSSSPDEPVKNHNGGEQVLLEEPVA
jgi:hypothetical protein